MIYYLFAVVRFLFLLFFSDAYARIPFLDNAYFSFEPYQVVIKVPVADMGSSFPPPYDPSLSPEIIRCRRAHQGLFNEIFSCTFTLGDACKVCCDTIVYGVDERGKQRNTFWVHKKDLIRLDECEQAGIASSIPGCSPNQLIVALTYPWRNLSVGTRLVHVSWQDTEDSYAVLLPDYIIRNVITAYVPRKDALVMTSGLPQEQRQLFVKLINQLIDRTSLSSDQVIAYVWGGSSLVRLYNANAFHQKHGAWHYCKAVYPYTGYDCSELVMRMAQLAGINFVWKTSQVMSEQCAVLARDSILEDGDLIWVPGHIIIVSSIANNEIIEARGYGSGYGRVHRIKLGECFKGIDDYDQLIDAYYLQKPLLLCDKQGEVVKVLPVFKILKLM
jgi:hypothetical protein